MSIYHAQLLSASALTHNKTKIIVRCPVDGKEYERELNTPIHKILKWYSDHHQPTFPKIQDYFHELSVDDREFIMTGIDEERWDWATKETD